MNNQRLRLTSAFGIFMATLKNQITAIKTEKKIQLKRSRIFLDGRFAFSLDNGIILKNKLQIGQTLSEKELEALIIDDRFEGCLNTALIFLSYRPRSTAETRARLYKHGYKDVEIDNVLERLKSNALLNDSAFAEYWRTNRTNFKPRGRHLLKSELKQKGLDSDTINQATEGIDEIANAHRAAITRARTLSTMDYQAFRQKLAGHLHRRGFDYGVVSKVVKQLWEERTGKTGPDIEEP